MIQEFILEIIKDVSFFERVKTRKGWRRRFKYQEESVFFKLKAKTSKDLGKKIDLKVEEAGQVIDWKIYGSFPFE